MVDLIQSRMLAFVAMGRSITLYTIPIDLSP
jgi:hypothetical protein